MPQLNSIKTMLNQVRQARQTLSNEVPSQYPEIVASTQDPEGMQQYSEVVAQYNPRLKTSVAPQFQQYEDAKYKYLDADISDVDIPDPPKDDSHTTRMELEEIEEVIQEAKLPSKLLRVSNEDPLRLFYSVAKKRGLDPHEAEAKAWADDWTKFSFELKDKYQRRRPWEVKKEHDIDFVHHKLDSTESPSYPSGHAMLAYGVAEFYKEKYPLMEEQWDDIADIIAHSRVQMGVHYPSDIKASKQVVAQVSGASKTASPKGVERLPSGAIKYRGETFPGYNKPKAAPKGSKHKKRVLAKKGDTVKVVNFGARGYKHNYSAKAKKSYLARSSGIKGKDDKFSANYWSRRELWPKNQKADGSAKKRSKSASAAPKHLELRRQQRAKYLDPENLKTIEDKVQSASDLPEGANYITLPHGRKAVVRTEGGKSHLATILGPAMRPPGRDVSSMIKEARYGSFLSKLSPEARSAFSSWRRGKSPTDKGWAKDFSAWMSESGRLNNADTVFRTTKDASRWSKMNTGSYQSYVNETSGGRGAGTSVRQWMQGKGLNYNQTGRTPQTTTPTPTPTPKFPTLGSNAKYTRITPAPTTTPATTPKTPSTASPLKAPTQFNRFKGFMGENKTPLTIGTGAASVAGVTAFNKRGSIDLLTGQMGAGKSTLLDKIRDQYDIVEGTDLGGIVDGKFVEPSAEDKPRLRQEKADRLLAAHNEGKRVLMEGYPPGLFRIPGMVEAADRAVVLQPDTLQRLMQIGKRSKERGTSVEEDIRFAVNPDHLAKENKYLDMLRKAIGTTHTAPTSEDAEAYLLGKQANDLSVLTEVPSQNLDLIMRKGLYSQKAMLDDPEVMAAFLAQRNADKAWKNDEQYDEKRFREQYAKRRELATKPEALEGPSVFYTEPDSDKVSDPRHFINQFDTQKLRVNLAKLLQDIPETRVHGAELEPFNEAAHEADPENYWMRRHRDLTPEEVAKYIATDPKELWKNYKDEYIGRYYAADVPHGHVITPSGIIPPEYLEQVEKTSSAKEQLKHILVTGHSGAGKSTYAKELAEELGIPRHRLDVPTGPIMEAEYPEYWDKGTLGYPEDVSTRVIQQALNLDTPHVIEGSHMLEVPELTEGYKRILVDTPEDRVVEQRAQREYRNQGRKGKPYRPIEEHRGSAKELVNFYRDLVSNYRDQPGVESIVPEVKTSEAKTLYHGSPLDLEELIPQQARGSRQSTGEHKQKAVYLAKDPKEALIYALMSRPDGLGNYGVADGTAYYPEGRPLNERGYVYKVDVDDYQEPEDPRAGVAIKEPLTPSSREEVLLKDHLDKLVSLPNHEAYRAKIRDILTKTSEEQPLLRHRSTLLIRDPETNKLLAANNREDRRFNDVSPYYFPGGGLYDDEYDTPRTPTEEEILEGARREALEELGITLKDPRVVGGSSITLPQEWRDKVLKRRGVPYEGGHEHLVLADKGDIDNSLYNIEGDAFNKGKYFDPQEVYDSLTEYGSSDGQFASYNREQARAIKEHLLGKQASARSKISEPLAPEILKSPIKPPKTNTPTSQFFVSGLNDAMPEAKRNKINAGFTANHKITGKGIPAVTGAMFGVRW